MRTHASSFTLFALFAGAPTTALADPPATPPPGQAAAKPELQVTSSAFKANEAIPPRYTCDGASTPPPLAWSTVPSGTRSIAIFVDDPDAPSGTFTHWLVTGIPPTTTSLRGGGGALPQGAVTSKNGRGAAKYTGPCPTSGSHRYVFHVYALETAIGAPAGRAELASAIDGHVLAEGQLVGVYQKITPP